MDSFFSGAEPFLRADAECYRLIRESRTKYKSLNEELDAFVKQLEKRKRQKPGPLLKPVNVSDILNGPVNGMTERDKEMARGAELCARLDRLNELIDETIEKGNALQQKFRTYQSRMTRMGYIRSDDLPDFGGVEVPVMQPMRIENPYEM